MFTIFGTTNEPDIFWQYALFFLNVRFLREETYVFENEPFFFVIYFSCTKY
jgi:hypothetical protein